MKNPFRKKPVAPPKPPKQTRREKALSVVEISDTDRLDRLVQRGVASRAELDAALRDDKRFVRQKLLAWRIRVAERERTPYFAMLTTDPALTAEVDRMLVEECGAP